MDILLSSYSYGRLMPMVLTGTIGLFLATRKKKHPSTSYLAAYFLFLTLFNFGYFYAYSVYSPAGALGWYLAAFAPLGLVFLIQFAYRFPEHRWKRESYAVLVITAAVFLWGFVDYIIRAHGEPIGHSETGYGSVYVSTIIPIASIIPYVWVAIVLFRQSLASRAIDGVNAARARFFGFLVLMELLNTLTIVLFMAFRFLPYRTIAMTMNLSFLAIYSLYSILYVNSSTQPVSLRNKLSGIALVLLLATSSLLGNIAISRFEGDYDRVNLEKLARLELLTAGYSPSNLPDDMEYIITYEKTGPAIQYLRDKTLAVSANIPLWDYTPGIVEAAKGSGARPGPDMPDGVRLLTQIAGKNYLHYNVTVRGERRGVGFSFLHYRRELHRLVLLLTIFVIAASFFAVMVLPLILHTGLVKPLNDIVNEAREAVAGEFDIDALGSLENDIQALSKTFGAMAQSVRERRSLIQENRLLKQRLEDKKAPSLSDSSKRKIESVMHYIRENYREPLEREELAGLAGLNPTRLGKLFKAQAGKRIGDFISEVRIEKAKERLQTTDTPVIDIAYGVGFESLRTFNRVFSVITGVSPTQYRDTVNK